MRLVFVLLALCSCQKQERVEAERDVAVVPPPSASVVAVVSASASAQPAVPSATASASVAAPARIPCGTTTCGPTQYCVHESRGQGIAPRPGQPSFTSTSVECRNSIPTGGYTCTAVGKNREVSCVALIPAAPPHGP